MAKADKAPASGRLRATSHYARDLYDDLVELAFDLIFAASFAKGSTYSVWAIQRLQIWDGFFGHEAGRSWSIFRYRLRREVFNQIKESGARPDFQNAEYLGFCLNAFGLSVGPKSKFRDEDRPLRIVVLRYAQRHFMTMHSEYPEVMQRAIQRSISFDPEKSQLVKTYERMLGKPGTEEVLRLDPARVK